MRRPSKKQNPDAGAATPPPATAGEKGHDTPGKPNPLTKLAGPLRGAARLLLLAAPVWAPFVAAAATGNTIVSFYTGHTTFGLITLIPFLAVLAHQYRSYTRVHPTATKGRGRPKPQAPLRSSYAIGKDTADIALFLDNFPQRIAHLVLLAAAVATPLAYPVSVDDWKHLNDTKHPTSVRDIVLSALGPLLYFGYLRLHDGALIRARTASVEAIWQIARDYLRYPKRLSAAPTRVELELMSPLRAVDVSQWKSLTEVDSAFVKTPSDLSVTEEKPWDEFGVNLNARLPRPEEWRVRRDPKGRGATIEAANYPTAILWDGQIDPDPLTFYLGVNLETGEPQILTLNEASPHLLVTGATSSGKTSGAEIITAQVLTKPMPWDPTLYGQVHFIDPKGTLARRWRGRRGVVTSEGTADHYCEVDPETGEPLGGIEVMAMHLQAIEDERLRRDKILAKYPAAATWVHLPDEVKRAERFAPIIVVLDEYLDHTDKITGNSPTVARENAARNKITELATAHSRKYRNVGMHTILIAQEAKMTTIGSAFVRNLTVRIVTGQMDVTQLGSMFGQDRDIPSLPSTRIVNGQPKTIPGRARVMNAGGQDINRVQIMWFGGKTNSETLDKWLPRGEEPLNGDFTSALGGTPGQVSDPADTPIIDPEMADADGDGEPDGGLVPDSEPAGLAADDVALPGQGDTPGEAPPAQGAPGGGGSHRVTPAPDMTATFPTANAHAPRCEQEGCANDATGTCPSCGDEFCGDHLYPPLEGTDPVCASCYWDHPVAKSGLAAVYSVMLQETEQVPSVQVSWEPAGEGRVRLVAARQGGKKLVEVQGADGQEPMARSRAGAVSGEAAVIDRVHDVFVAAAAHTPAETGGAS